MKNSDLLDVEAALKLDRGEVSKFHKNYVNPAFTKMLKLLNFDKHFVRARGMRVQDSEGNEYLDFLGAFGALNFGHNPPEIIKAVNKANDLPNLLNVSLGTMEAAAARNLSKITPGDLTNTFFANSGTEAVEGAIKLARTASNKEKIIYCEGSFHGKSMGSLSLTGRSKYQDPFRPLLPATEMVPFGETDQLEFKLKEGNIAAVILEPIQGEGGIIVPPSGYLKSVRELCDRYNTYLILDEIQTGFGRTGYDFACEEEGIVPDIMTLAKSLGGGVMPVGAFITGRDIWNKAYGEINKALLHTSTFGGNNLASAAVVAATGQLIDQDLSSEARDKGDYFLEKLAKLAEKYELIAEVRGKGLMIGIEFKQPGSGLLDKLSGGMVNKLSFEYLGAMVATTLLNDYNIITAYTLNNPNVIRMEPPLIVSYRELDQVLEALDNIFSENKGFLDFTVNSARQAISGFFN